MTRGITSFHWESDADVVESFLKLLYGHRLALTSNKLFKVWLLSYVLKEILVNNVTQLSVDNKVKLLKNINVIPIDFIEKLGLKDIREMTSRVNDVEVLKLFVEASISRYGEVTKALKAENDKLLTELSVAQSKISKLETKSTNQTATGVDEFMKLFKNYK